MASRNGYAPPSSGDSAAVDETVELANDLRHRFRDRDALYARIDEVLFMEGGVDIPAAYRKTALEVRSPLAIHMANTVAAALTTNPLTIQFRPIAFGDVAQQNATLREHFFEASWHRQEQEANAQLLRLFMYALATKGEGVIKTIERTKTAWAEYTTRAQEIEAELEYDREYDQDAKDRVYHRTTEELKLQAPYPIASIDVPPETFYYSKNENGFACCVEIKQVPYLEALQCFGTGMDSHGRVYDPQDWSDLDPRAMGLAESNYNRVMRGTNQMLTIVEAWDYELCNIICIGPGQQSSGSSSLGNGTLVKSFNHGYGDPVLKTLRGPYFHCYGITTNSRLPGRAGMGVLNEFLDLFPLLDSLLTIQGNGAYMTGFPAFKRTSPPNSVPSIPAGGAPFGGDGRERAAAEPIEPGTIYPYDIAPVDQPRGGPMLTELLQNVQTMIQLALPTVVQGVTAGEQSGYAMNQAAYLARLAWDPIVKNAQSALGMRTGFESWLIEHRIGEDVYAWAEELPKNTKTGPRRGSPQFKAGWVGIGPEDLTGVHRYEAHLDIATPSDDVVTTRAIAEKLNLKLMTLEDAQREMGGNPDEIERSNLLIAMKQTPEIQAKLKELVFQKLGTLQAAGNPASGPSNQEMAGMMPAPMGGMQIPGQPPSQPSPGGIPGNPVPSPGQGIPAPQGPTPVAVPVRQGGVSGAPVVPNMPMNAPPPIAPGAR